MNEYIQLYIKDINAQYQTGNAREHAYRPALKDLLSSLLKHYTVINEPARIDCGAPDFMLMKGTMPMAFVEAKDINDGDLDGTHTNKEQFTRYKQSLNTIIFTDYLDFHLYEDGAFVDSVRLAEVKGTKIVLLPENEDKFLQIIARLGNAKPQKITSSQKLAQLMAAKARLLRTAYPMIRIPMRNRRTNSNSTACTKQYKYYPHASKALSGRYTALTAMPYR